MSLRSAKKKKAHLLERDGALPLLAVAARVAGRLFGEAAGAAAALGTLKGAQAFYMVWRSRAAWLGEGMSMACNALSV